MLSCIQLFCAGKKGSSGELLGIACSDDKSGNALHVSVSFSTLDISVVDHLPEELIAVTIQGLSFGVALGIGPEGTFQRMQLSLQKLQIDDQLSASRYTAHSLHVVLPVAMPASSVREICNDILCAAERFVYHYSITLSRPARETHALTFCAAPRF